MKIFWTSKHSSRACTARLPIIPASVATRCQYRWKGPVQLGPMNKFEQVSSDGHQVSWGGGSPHVPRLGVVGGGLAGDSCNNFHLHDQLQWPRLCFFCDFKLRYVWTCFVLPVCLKWSRLRVGDNMSFPEVLPISWFNGNILRHTKF